MMGTDRSKSEDGLHGREHLLSCQIGTWEFVERQKWLIIQSIDFPAPDIE